MAKSLKHALSAQTLAVIQEAIVHSLELKTSKQDLGLDDNEILEAVLELIGAGFCSLIQTEGGPRLELRDVLDWEYLSLQEQYRLQQH